MVARTSRGRSTLSNVLAAERSAAKNGYAITDEELALGLRSMAVPVFGAAGDVVAAVSVSAASARVKVAELRKRLLPVLLACADKITQPMQTSRL